MEAFCGFHSFATEETLDPSTLTKVRQRLGRAFFRELERKTYNVLIARRIIKAKEMLADATGFPESIKYPHDVGLLNDVRRWLVKNIHRLGKALGAKRARTYRRNAEQEYLRFSKKKLKTNKTMVDPGDPMIPISRQCELLRFARSSFYYNSRRDDSYNRMLINRIDEQFTRAPFYGVPKMTAWLRAEGYPVNPKRIRRLMRLMGLEAIYAKPRTSVGGPDHKIYP